MQSVGESLTTARPRRALARTAALIALLTGSIFFVAGLGAQSAFAATTVHVHQASLDQSNSCPGDTTATGAHFVLTQIAKAAQPDGITVFFSNNTSLPSADAQHHNNEAGYDVFFTAGLTVTDATALVPDTWSGQFNLSHYICGDTTTTPPPSTTPPTTTTSAPPTSETASISASSSTVVVTVGVAPTSDGPIPAAVAAGNHTTSSTPLALGGALMAAGVAGLLFTTRLRRRGSRV